MPDLTLVKPEIPTALSRLVDDYLAHCRASNLSVRTWKGAYGYTLERIFLPWCAEQGVAEPSQLDTRLLERFTTKLLEEGGRQGPLSKASVNSYSRSVKCFLTWAEEEGELGGPVKVSVPRAPKRVIDVLSRDEIDAMENAAKTERDKLLVRVLAGTGIRLGELLGLQARDIVETARGQFQLKVHGKGEKERLVPLSPALVRRLRRYLAGRRADARDRIFIGLRKGPSGEYAPLTQSGAEQAIRFLAVAAGIEKRVYPHLFRHSYATHMLRKGMNVLLLQEILGHSSLTMIQTVYSHLDTDDAYKAAMKVLLGEE
ncbi:MAG: tyrosine-type recombinase/integrase [Candidatus Dormibacteria bacterium]|jgi:integrase/recombinase XerD